MIGLAVKKELLDQGLKIKDLARLTRYDYSYVSKFLRGNKRSPRLEFIISTVLKKDKRELFPLNQ